MAIFKPKNSLYCRLYFELSIYWFERFLEHLDRNMCDIRLEPKLVFSVAVSLRPRISFSSPYGSRGPF